jgi:hypothetical protein
MKTLLVAILEEMRRLEAVPDRPVPGMDREQWRTQWYERRDYERFGVHHDLALWIGHAPTPSDSAVFSRALRNMEAMGLVARISRWDGARATHVQLTDMGRTEAERLVVDQDAAMAAPLKNVELAIDGAGEAPQEGQ